MNRIIFSFVVLLALVMTSCSGGDYRDAIPQGSIALVSIDAQKASEQSKQISDLVTKSLGVDDINSCGIDLTQKIYLFESADGNFGLCAKVADDDDVDETFQKALSKGFAKSAGERQGCTFYNIGDSWVAGFTGDALLIMGPVLPSSRAQLMQQMTAYMTQEGDNGFSKSKIMKEMDTHTSIMAMVIQLNALPNQEEVQGLLSLGAPKNAEISNLLISADVDKSGDILKITGQLTSYNKNTAATIKENYAKLDKISELYATQISDDCVLSFLTNGKGDAILSMLQDNKGMMSSMAGLNAVIDLNKIVRSINGDMVLQCSSIDKENTNLNLAAQISDDSFMNDINYWKESAPAGGTFAKDADGWLYESKKDKINFHFGVENKQFYCGLASAKALTAGSHAKTNQAIIDSVKGKKIAFVISLSKLLEGRESLTSLLPLIGDVKTIVLSY